MNVQQGHMNAICKRYALTHKVLTIVLVKRVTREMVCIVREHAQLHARTEEVVAKMENAPAERGIQGRTALLILTSAKLGSVIAILVHSALTCLAGTTVPVVKDMFQLLLIFLLLCV